MRAFGVFPIGRADEDFAVAPALPAMKFVNRHGGNITGAGKMFKRQSCVRYKIESRLSAAASGAFNMSATGCSFGNLESGDLPLRLNGKSNHHKCSVTAKGKAKPKILF
jgi:hypothetical protein